MVRDGVSTDSIMSGGSRASASRHESLRVATPREVRYHSRMHRRTRGPAGRTALFVSAALSVALSLTLSVGCASTSSEPATAANVVDVPPPPSGGHVMPPESSASESSAPPPGAGKWIRDEPAAQALAHDGKLPLLIDFRADWCAACHELDKTFHDAAVERQLGRFALLTVDATNDDDPTVKRLIERYHVVGLPTVLVFDSKGREVHRVQDFVSVKDFLPLVTAVR